MRRRPLVNANPTDSPRSNIRYLMLTVLFVVTTVTFADRATLSMAAPAMGKDLGLDAMAMGYAFSAFGWSYAALQIPGGWLLDRFGSRLGYSVGIFFLSLCFLSFRARWVTLRPPPPLSRSFPSVSGWALAKPRHFPPTAGLRPCGSQPMSGVLPRPFLIRRNILPWRFFVPCWAGAWPTLAGNMFFTVR